MKKVSIIWHFIEGPGEAMKARLQLARAVKDVVRSWRLTQIEAAEKLELTQPRLNDLLRGKIDKFSLDALFDLLPYVGLKASIVLKQDLKPSRGKA